MNAEALAKTLNFAEFVGFSVEGATIVKLEDREIDEVIVLKNGADEIHFIANKDGNFDNYTRETIVA